MAHSASPEKPSSPLYDLNPRETRSHRPRRTVGAAIIHDYMFDGDQFGQLLGMEI
jgi:hypothetical protein